MKIFIAEFLGTAVLVLIGCGAIALGGYGGTMPLGILPIGLAFGLAVTVMAYGIGPVSGCHINPAVTIGVWAAGRLPTSQLPHYIVAQFAGAIVGAAVLYVLVSGKLSGYDVAAAGLGQNGWGEGYGGGFSLFAALIAELVATFIFLVVILGSTSKAGATPVAGLAIGLTLFICHLAFVPVSGASLNPARSFGPALFVGGKALAQVWLFIVVPPIGGFLAGLLFKSKTLEA